jgi:hypothetical protein
MTNLRSWVSRTNDTLEMKRNHTRAPRTKQTCPRTCSRPGQSRTIRAAVQAARPAVVHSLILIQDRPKRHRLGRSTGHPDANRHDRSAAAWVRSPRTDGSRTVRRIGRSVRGHATSEEIAHAVAHANPRKPLAHAVAHAELDAPCRPMTGTVAARTAGFSRESAKHWRARQDSNLRPPA